MPYASTCTIRTLLRQSELRLFDTKFGEEKHAGLPLKMMQKKCGGRDDFLESMTRGDVFKVEEEDGRELYYYRSKAAVWRRGQETNDVLDRGKKKITDAQAFELNNSLRKIGWAPDFSKKEQKAIDGGDDGINSSTLECLEKASRQMMDATKTCHKMIKLAEEGKQIEGLPKAVGQLKKDLRATMALQAEVDQAVTLKESADGSVLNNSSGKKLLFEAAKAAEAMYKQQEVTKTFVKMSKVK